MKKPFNLEYYLEHPETKVVTRGGTSGHTKNARIISTDTKSIHGYIITALIPTGPQGSENAYSFDINGRYMGGTTKSELDLFFDLPDPIKKKVPLTYKDLMERVKADKTMWMQLEYAPGCYSTFNIMSFNHIGIKYEDNILSYKDIIDAKFTFLNGDPCWKEVEE